jgi:hypothetical protein
LTSEQILDRIDEVVRNYPGNENDDNIKNILRRTFTDTEIIKADENNKFGINFDDYSVDTSVIVFDSFIDSLLY